MCYSDLRKLACDEGIEWSLFMVYSFNYFFYDCTKVVKEEGDSYDMLFFFQAEDGIRAKER